MHVIVRVQIGAVTLQSSEIEHLEVTQELGAHTRCFLHFLRDRDTDLSLDAMLGQTLTVTLQDEVGTVAPFTGTVLEGSQGHQLNHGSAFSIEAVGGSWSLERPETAYFTASKLQDLASRFGAKVTGSPAAKPAMQYVQFGETDFAFLVRVADDHGMFVRTTDPKPEVRAGFEEIGTPLKWGRDLLAVTASGRADAHSAAGAGHRPEEKRDHRFRNVRKNPTWLNGASRLTNAASRLADKASNGGNGSVHELPHRSPTLADARKTLEHESERRLGASVTVSGTSTNIRLRSGDTIKLEESDAFALPTQGTLGLVKVVHLFDGQLYTNEFVATPWGGWSAAVQPAREMAHGCVTGDVMDNVDPQNMGRLKVRLRWNDNGEGTRWVRYASIYAGNMRGVHFLPEIGDEVLVMFEMGDPERPVVVGSLWNGVDKAPTMEKNEAKRIVTRNGNTIQIFDKDDDERIEVFTAKGQCWMQLHNNGGKPLITIHSEGDIALEAKEEIRLSCQTLTADVKSDFKRKVGGKEVADVSGDLTSKSGGKHATDGMNVVVKAGAMVDVAAGGITSIIGSMVHIQPPGKMVPPVIVPPSPPAKSAWQKQEQPKKGEGRTSADPRVGK